MHATLERMGVRISYRWLAPAIAAMVVFSSGSGYAAPTVAPIDPYLLPSEPPADFDLAVLERRHRMLRWHEALAIASIVSFGAQVAVGQIVMAREGEVPTATSTRRLRDASLGLSLASGATYLAAASLAVAAPAIPRGPRYDAFTWHKGLTMLHGVGAVLVPVLGLAIADERGQSAPDAVRLQRLQTVQQAAGYTTLGTLIGAAVVIAID